MVRIHTDELGAVLLRSDGSGRVNKLRIRDVSTGNGFKDLFFSGFPFLLEGLPAGRYEIDFDIGALGEPGRKHVGPLAVDVEQGEVSELDLTRSWPR